MTPRNMLGGILGNEAPETRGFRSSIVLVELGVGGGI